MDRLHKEWSRIQLHPGENGITLNPRDETLRRWTVHIKGPSGTAYEGGVFELAMNVGETYPITPPHMEFRTKIFHPNVLFKTGEICLDVLKAQWTPAWNLQSVCLAIVALMESPEPASPLNCDAGNLMRHGDMEGFNSLARMYTIDYAMSPLKVT